MHHSLHSTLDWWSEVPDNWLTTYRQVSGGQMCENEPCCNEIEMQRKSQKFSRCMALYLSNNTEQSVFHRNTHQRFTGWQVGGDRDSRDMWVILGCYYLFSWCGCSLSQQSITKVITICKELLPLSLPKNHSAWAAGDKDVAKGEWADSLTDYIRLSFLDYN